MTDKKYYQKYNYYDREPLQNAGLTDLQRKRLIESKTFCMIPWIHMHAFPNGQAYPCCLARDDQPIGDLHQDTMKTVWNSPDYRQMRVNMLNDNQCSQCSRCYEQEDNGFVSMRNNTNKSFGHLIPLVDKTNKDGSLDEFKLRYYDIRFSNLCNMSCRTCGHWFSSSWYQDEVALWGEKDTPQFMYAGRDREDMWEQMQEHIPYLEQIYFAGGEPLIQDEHYRTLAKLIELGKTDVRLIYNTNFSRLRLQSHDVLDLWQHFSNVSVGASLDAEGDRAEYMRHGTRWDQIVKNRRDMQEKCPHVDFYVSATVSIMNVLHVADFHRSWAKQGLIKAQDWNVNILQGPERMRVNHLPNDAKPRVIAHLQHHLDWLEPRDRLRRATGGYNGLIEFIRQPGNHEHLNEFVEYTHDLDELRNEKFSEVFPEWQNLK